LLVLVLIVAVVYANTLPLGLRADAQVSGEVLIKLKELQGENLDFLAKRLVLKEHVTREEADRYVLDFTRWMSLNLFSNASVTLPISSPVVDIRGPFVPSNYVDEAWHNFILYTKEYHAWCFKHFGRFIHHVPENEDVVEEQAIHANNWAKTVILMRDLYDVEWNKTSEGECGDCKSIDAGSCGGCGTSGNCKTAGEKAGCGGCGTSGNCKTVEGKAGCGGCGSSTGNCKSA